MERMKPIEDVKFIGCLNCTTIATKTLDKEMVVNGDMVFLNGVKQMYGVKVGDIEAKENDYICFTSALHDETYQLQDGEWVLVKQGLGYA